MNINTPIDPARRDRRHWLRQVTLAAVPLALLPLAGGLAGCASLGIPLSLHFTESELNDLLAQQFPKTDRVAQLIDVQMAKPKLWLLPDRRRVGAAFSVGASDRLFGKGLDGRLVLDSGLRFDTSDGTLHLTDVRVQQLDIDAGSGSLPISAQRLGGLLAEHLLENLAIYRMKPETVDRMHALGFHTANLSIGGSGVDLSLAR
jgi:hypothetical protein